MGEVIDSSEASMDEGTAENVSQLRRNHPLPSLKRGTRPLVNERAMQELVCRGVVHQLKLRAVCVLTEASTLMFESIDGHSLHVRSLHARNLCVNLIDESRVLAKKAVDSFECVERSGGGNTTAITQRQDRVLPLRQLREDHHGEDSKVSGTQR